MTVEAPQAASIRLGLLGGLVARDLIRAPLSRLASSAPEPAAGALGSAIDWLILSHEVTGRRGSSKGFSLLRGWLGAYPETTGYVIGTMLEYGSRVARPELLDRAVAMGVWETEVQLPDGGVMQGTVGEGRPRSIVFNTGMVLHGWLDLIDRGEARFGEPAARAARFLAAGLRKDGTWEERFEYSNIPHTYNSRVAWAMLRFAAITGQEEVREKAVRQLEWTLEAQRPSGWFDHCVFKPGMLPSTHAIAYTLRGLLESSQLLGEDRYLEAVLRTSEVLIRKLEVLGGMPGAFRDDWSAAARYECLTGVAQLGGVWLRLYQLTGDARFLNAGLKAVDRAARHQERGGWPAVRGALAGSFPLTGAYAPLQYPNWATKFLADGLMLREDCLRTLSKAT